MPYLSRSVWNICANMTQWKKNKYIYIYMRIVIYSFVALFIKLPFREPFRENPLPLPGSFRDSAFSLFGMFWSHFPKTIDGENEEESGKLQQEVTLARSILTYLATWRLNGESCPGLLAWPSTLRTCRNIMPSSPSICSFWPIAPPEQLLGFPLPDTLPGKWGNYFRRFLDQIHFPEIKSWYCAKPILD